MEKKELQVLANVLNNEHGFKFILLLLEYLGAFERGINCALSDKELFKTLCRREQGFWLLDNILKANFNKYIEILQIIEKE